MISFPNAKINLGLQVTGKRSDGYHNIETVFYPVQWREALEIIPSRDFKMTHSGIEIDIASENNLCARVWQLMHDKYKIPPVHIHLHKVIPMGAGLGGGSSDAAFTIKIINNIFQLNLEDNNLEDTATEIGSDCAFFIKNKPVLALGKGNIFTDINLNLKGYKIIIIKPEISINTTRAYSEIIPGKKENILDIINLNIHYWKDKLTNDFEKLIFKKHPEIKKIKEGLYNAGAIYASMSGSGSAVYGFFKNEIVIKNNLIENRNVWMGEL